MRYRLKVNISYKFPSPVSFYKPLDPFIGIFSVFKATYLSILIQSPSISRQSLRRMSTARSVVQDKPSGRDNSSGQKNMNCPKPNKYFFIFYQNFAQCPSSECALTHAVNPTVLSAIPLLTAQGRKWSRRCTWVMVVDYNSIKTL